MTGRARIGDQTRIQIVWEHLRTKPATCNAVWNYIRILDPCTHTAVDKTLRDMVRKRYLTRHLQLAPSGQRWYVYAAAGNEPPKDGRVTKIQDAIIASAKARKGRVSARTAPVDHDDDEDDTWGRGRCAKRTGTPDELPRIPSLAEMLAR
jgi:hypothetical protein